MSRFPLETTAPGGARSLDDQTQAPPVLAFATLASRSQPHRAGEVGFLPYEETLFIGRGDEPVAEFVRFSRRRPGETLAADPHEDLLLGKTMSRRQLVVRANAVAVDVENVGRCEMLVNGVETKSASVKPGDTVRLRGEHLFLCIRRPMELPHPGGFVQAFGEPDLAGIIGESAVAWLLRHQLAVAARSSDHVMIQGLSGSGKELAARAIHLGSDRAKGPFVSRNVANITRSILQSELFGNNKNYPNPGMPARDGVVGAADGGSLLLDEIGDCPLEIQVSLMRLLDSGEYDPVGEGTSRRADLRIIGATNRDNSAFKSDLLARFLTRVLIPPLRERREDIPLLVRHWLLDRARKNPEEAGRFIEAGPSGRPEPRVSSRLLEYLVRQPLPLNVRELNGLLVLAIRAGASNGDTVNIPSLPDLPAAETPESAAAGAAPEAQGNAKPREWTKEEIVDRLEREGGNITRAAAALGLDRSTLRGRMKRYGIK